MANFLLQIILFVLLVVSCQCYNNFDIDVVHDFGAVGDGRQYDTEVFEKAWEATCKSSASAPTMHIPAGKTFLLQPLAFSGPCNSNNISVVIDGTLTAPSDPSHWPKCNDDYCKHWLSFMHVDGLFIRGSGTINPQGRKWWTDSCHHKKHGCRNRPTGFVIAHSNNVQIDSLTFKDSPKFHIAIERSTDVHITNLNIVAPEASPNTDGIHIQQSTNVVIQKSRIATGDDCISIGDGSSNLAISNISCGPGHGISIGSLGKHGDHETVENVRVSDIIFRNTSNGVRIKTWQGGRGYARNIVFERISTQHAEHPIIIDQYYCDHENCKNHTSAVQISNIKYDQIQGISGSETGVKLACSESVPCRNILMKDVNIKSSKDGKETASYCLNARGRQRGMAVPNVPCLSQT